jgi:hypothetical protein
MLVQLARFNNDTTNQQSYPQITEQQACVCNFHYHHH